MNIVLLLSGLDEFRTLKPGKIKAECDNLEESRRPPETGTLK